MDNTIPDLCLGSRDTKDDCTQYPVYKKEDNTPYEIVMREVSVHANKGVVSIHAKNNDHIKMFVALQAKLTSLIEAKVRVRDKATLQNMLLLTAFDDAGCGYIKLNSKSEIPEGCTSLKLSCKAFNIYKKRIVVEWDVTPSTEEDDEIIVIVQDDEEFEKFREEYDSELESMTQISDNSRHLVSILQKIGKLMQSDDRDTAKLRVYMNEYFETKNSLFE